MIEVRFHGRGGQGAVMASRILSNAFVRTGRYGASFPMFGFERRGAPVTAFGRFGDRPVREKTQIYHPDVLVVLDPAQKESPSVFDGLKPEGTMILNSRHTLDGRPSNNLATLGRVDATAISLAEIGMAMPNTAVLGAFARTCGIIDLPPLLESLGDYFESDRLAANIRCCERGYSEVEVYAFA